MRVHDTIGQNVSLAVGHRYLRVCKPNRGMRNVVYRCIQTILSREILLVCRTVIFRDRLAHLALGTLEFEENRQELGRHQFERPFVVSLALQRKNKIRTNFELDRNERYLTLSTNFLFVGGLQPLSIDNVSRNSASIELGMFH